jgi:biofilm protein TabA
MALFGSLATVRAQLGATEQFRSAFAYLDDATRPGSAPYQRLFGYSPGQTERVDLAGGAFALEQVYPSKPRTEGFFESHLAYIDVQVMLAGEEFMEVADIARLSLKEDRTPAKDVLVYHMFDRASVLRMTAGEVAIFFPVDGHMGGLSVKGTDVVRKIVVKVPVVKK